MARLRRGGTAGDARATGGLEALDLWRRRAQRLHILGDVEVRIGRVLVTDGGEVSWLEQARGLGLARLLVVGPMEREQVGDGKGDAYKSKSANAAGTAGYVPPGRDSTTSSNADNKGYGKNSKAQAYGGKDYYGKSN